MIGVFAVTPAGRRAAADLVAWLGPDAFLVTGPIGPAVQRLWPRLGSAVFFLSTATTVRMIAPLLGGRGAEPGVVCVDDDHRFAVALTGGVNVLTERVADRLGCVPVLTSARAASGATLVDDLVDQLNATADGDVDACAQAMAQGRPVRLLNPLDFPLPVLPGNVAPDNYGAEWTVLIDDRIPPLRPRGKLLRLIPRTLVVGVGCRAGVEGAAVTAALGLLESEHDLDPRAVLSFATVDAKAEEPGILAAVEDWAFWHGEGTVPPLALHTAAELSTVDVPHPGAEAYEALGTPSVAEAAALYSAQGMAGAAPVELAAPKTKGDNVTIAAARVRPPSTHVSKTYIPCG